MTANPEPKAKPPFLRRRWPYFALGFLLALPVPNLAWRAFERFWYGGPTKEIIVMEFDAHLIEARGQQRYIDGSQEWIRMSDGKTLVWDSVRTASSTATIRIRYYDPPDLTIREADATVDLDSVWRRCFVQIRHRAEQIEISPCLPGLRGP